MTICRVAAIAFAILFASRSAHADADARGRAARAKLDVMIRSLADGKLDAFAAMFPDTDASAVMFPSSRFASTGRKAIRTAADEWLGVGRTASAAGIVGTSIISQRADKDATRRGEHMVVISGALEVTLKELPSKPVAYRVTAVLSDGLDPAAPGAFIPTAMFITQAFEDRELRGEDMLGESSEIDRFLDLLRVPDLLASQFDAAPFDIVIGTSSRDQAIGADAKQLLQRWRGRKLTVIGKPHVVRQLDWAYAMATVSLTRKGLKPAPINVLLVGYPECKKSCIGADMSPHVIALHFGQAK